MPTFTAHPPAAGDEAAPPAAPPPDQDAGARYRDHFFGSLQSQDRPITVHGHTWTVRLRILEADESRRCAYFAYERTDGHIEGDDYLIAQTIARVAFMLEAVDGKPVSSECRTLEQRLQLAASLYDTLQDAIIEAYNELRQEPIALLGEMVADPTSGQAPMPTGSSPEPAVFPTRD